MKYDLQAQVYQRITHDYSLKDKGGDWLQQGICPSCGKRELFTHAKSPWVLTCGRENNCGEQFHVKDLYPDLFEDWSKRAPATKEDPAATAKAYLRFNRGFDIGLCGSFSQESYYDQATGESSATVRFALRNGWWERIIDRPHRFDKKARFEYGQSFKGYWWAHPKIDFATVTELWIVEGIFDAIALMHHGIAAVSAMSCNHFPEHSFAELLQLRAGKLPRILWALDNEEGKKQGKGARAYTRQWVLKTRELGFTSGAALLPRSVKGKDWNDVHQYWQAIESQEKRHATINKVLTEAKQEGALLMANSAEEKGILMWSHQGRSEFSFEFERKLYWLKMDLDKLHKALNDIEDNDNFIHHTEEQKRLEAARQTGTVSEIANCNPVFLYFQRNEVTDEAWYYARIDSPGRATEKGTFTAGQITSASEFKKRLAHIANGRIFTGSSKQLDNMMRYWVSSLKTVETVDFIGYSKSFGCYVYNDIAVKDGKVYPINEEDYFDIGKLRLKSLQKSVNITICRDEKKAYQGWEQLIWNTSGVRGVIACAWWLGSVFCEQIRARHKYFPFIEITGEANSGKSMLITFLWKLLGREDYEGNDPSKMTRSGRRRNWGQVASMPVVLIESDRSGGPDNKLKSFDFDELKDFYSGGTLGVTGQKTAGNETYEPPFRAAICISQNATVEASEATLSRIVKLHFESIKNATSIGRESAMMIEGIEVEQVSGFLMRALQAEQNILTTYTNNSKTYIHQLRQNPELRMERIMNNHGWMMALVDCLGLVCQFQPEQLQAAKQELAAMAVDRQRSLSADHPLVAEFWEVYDYLESIDLTGYVNHSTDEKLIAINLNDFYTKAGDHRQNLPDIKTMRALLKESRSHKLLETNKSTYSKIRAKSSNMNTSPTVKCWIFQA